MVYIPSSCELSCSASTLHSFILMTTFTLLGNTKDGLCERCTSALPCMCTVGHRAWVWKCVRLEALLYLNHAFVAIYTTTFLRDCACTMVIAQVVPYCAI